MYALVLQLALLQAAPATGAVALRSGCSADDEQVASISASDRIQVGMALAGESQTCYKVTVLKGEEKLSGYVLGDALPAIAAFVHGREMASKAAAEEEARLAREAALQQKKAAAGAAEPAKPADPLVSTQFADFSARDIKGKTISLSGLNGKVTVVAFWSPSDHRSLSQLESVMPLYNQFHTKGLAAVGISTDPRPQRISDAMDDVTLPFAQIPDQAGLAARYNVDSKGSKIFVLDANHRIMAAGPMGPDIVKAVHQALNVPDAQ